MHPVLIADTEESTREALKHILADTTPLIIVETQTNALEVLKKTPSIHLVFMGLHNETGISTDVFENIRDTNPRITLVALGDHRSEAHALEAVRRGATGYMIKPFKAEEIMSIRDKTLST